MKTPPEENTLVNLIKCRFCEKRFKYRRERLAHEKKDHPGESRPPPKSGAARQKAWRDLKKEERDLKEANRYKLLYYCKIGSPEPPAPDPPAPKKCRLTGCMPVTWSASGYAWHRTTKGDPLRYDPIKKKYFDKNN